MKKTIERGEYDGIPGSLIKAYFNAQQREQEQDRAEGELELAMSHFKKDNKKGKKKEKKKRKVRPIDTTEIEGIPGSGEYNLFNESLKTIKYAIGKDYSEAIGRLYRDGKILVDYSLPEEKNWEGKTRGTLGSTSIYLPYSMRFIHLSPGLFSDNLDKTKRAIRRGYELAGNEGEFRKRNFEYRVKLAGILVHEYVHLEQGFADIFDFETPAYTAEINFYKNLLEKIKANDPNSYKIPVLEKIIAGREAEAESKSNYGKQRKKQKRPINQPAKRPMDWRGGLPEGVFPGTTEIDPITGQEKYR